MDLRQLQYFVTVADKGTISAAARELFMSQPPLSMQIQALEKEFGLPLFERASRRMKLTEAGRALYARACTILDLSASVRHEMRDLKEGTAGTMRIGVVSSMCSSLFFHWIRDFLRLNRNVKIQMYEANTYQLLEMVRTSQVELAFVRTPFSAPDLNTRIFYREPLCAVGLPDFFPEQSEHSIELEGLTQAPLLIYRRWERVLSEEFQRKSLKPYYGCVSDDARTTLSMAEAGLGLGIVPQSILLDSPGGLRICPIAHPELWSDVCAVYREDAYISQVTQSFLDSIPQVPDRKSELE